MRSSEVKRWFLAGPAMTLGLLLSGCGGGGDGVASMPPPTYTKLADLSGDRSFQSAGVHFTFGSGQLSGQSIQRFGAGVRIDYNAANDSYTLTAPDGATDTFSSSTSVAPVGYTPPANVTVLFNNTGSHFAIPTLSGSGVTFSYLQLGDWDHIRGGIESIYLTVSGVPTIARDMPRSGTATYRTGIAGTVFQGALPSYSTTTGSSSAFSADFGAGTVSTTIHLVAAQPNASAVDFGSYSGNGRIASGGPGFAGALTPAPGNAFAATGEYSGAFFGPQAQEMGYGWYLKDGGISAQGVVIGTK
jgi:hypothetical protein